MNIRLKLFFSLCILLSSFVLKGQNDNPVRAEGTILKINKNQNPYSSNQTLWLKKNGFRASEYDWNNEDLNRQLDACLKRQTGANIFGVIAGASGILTLQKLISGQEGQGGYFLLSMTSGLISIGKSNKSKRQVRQIEKWRLAPASDRLDTTYLLEESKREFSLKSPYKPSKNKYLIRNGFDLHAYTWDNRAVDLNLEKAIASRRSGHVMLGMAGGAFVLGSFFKMLSAIVETDEGRNDASSIGNTFFIASGGMLLTSVIFTSSAKNKVRKAEKLRRLPKSNKSSLSIKDMN
ncbi:MAG: hypothetical protein ABJH72_08905 [Reichenbachiella sp.]|uniref:hypothetical protein n=1 Tax=Reichenbachiella sp. TaxID=2184521 RepID=UPI003265E9D1